MSSASMTPTTEQLKDLLAKVTLVEWSVGKQVIGIRNEHGFQHHIVHTLWDTARGKADATLIALAPTLAAEVVRLRIVADAFNELLATVEGECPSLVDEDSGAGQVLLNLLLDARQALDATSAV